MKDKDAIEMYVNTLYIHIRWQDLEELSNIAGNQLRLSVQTEIIYFTILWIGNNSS